MTRRALLRGAPILLGAWATASAQSSKPLRDAGIAAYRALAYDSSITLLRRSLAAATPQPPPDSVRAGSFVYLGAAEHLRGRDPEARGAFVEALRADPRIRPDTLTFPPAITALFQSVCRSTAFIAVRAAHDTIVLPDTGRYQMQVYVSSPHQATIELWKDGASSRTLFAGLITDSVRVGWNGLVANGSRVADGVAELRIAVAAESTRVLRLPIQLHWARGGPPASAGARTSPEVVAPPGGDVRALAVGLLTGVIVAALPRAVSDAPHPSEARFVVAGAATVAGILAFARIGHGPDRPESPPVRALDPPPAPPTTLEIRALWSATDLEATR